MIQVWATTAQRGNSMRTTQLLWLLAFGASVTLSACTFSSSMTAEPGLCGADGGEIVQNGNTTRTSIGSGNIFAPDNPGGTSNNSSSVNAASGNGNGTTVICCVVTGTDGTTTQCQSG